MQAQPADHTTVVMPGLWACKLERQHVQQVRQRAQLLAGCVASDTWRHLLHGIRKFACALSGSLFPHTRSTAPTSHGALLCRFVGLLLLASAIQSPDLEQAQLKEVSKTIYDAASTFLLRLLMPLRSPSCIAAITSRTKREDQLQGVHQVLKCLWPGRKHVQAFQGADC